MKLIGLLFLLVLVVAGVGYFRGWFTITTAHASGMSGMNMTIDNRKLGADADADAVIKQFPCPPPIQMTARARRPTIKSTVC